MERRQRSSHLRFLPEDAPAAVGGTEPSGDTPGTEPRPSASERSRWWWWSRGSGDAVARRDDGGAQCCASGDGSRMRARDADTRCSWDAAASTGEVWEFGHKTTRPCVGTPLPLLPGCLLLNVPEDWR